MRYECHYQSGKRSTKWACELKIKRRISPYEVEIVSNESRFNVIFGSHQFGNFACIPSWDIGCELAAFEDVFWNSERLRRRLNRKDALTIAKGIALAMKII